jgi:hypothetical protein
LRHVGYGTVVGCRHVYIDTHVVVFEPISPSNS